MQNGTSINMAGYSAPMCLLVDITPAGPLMGSYFIPPIAPAQADPSELF